MTEQPAPPHDWTAQLSLTGDEANASAKSPVNANQVSLAQLRTRILAVLIGSALVLLGLALMGHQLKNQGRKLAHDLAAQLTLIDALEIERNTQETELSDAQAMRENTSKLIALRTQSAQLLEPIQKALANTPRCLTLTSVSRSANRLSFTALALSELQALTFLNNVEDIIVSGRPSLILSPATNEPSSQWALNMRLQIRDIQNTAATGQPEG